MFATICHLWKSKLASEVVQSINLYNTYALYKPGKHTLTGQVGQTGPAMVGVDRYIPSML